MRTNKSYSELIQLTSFEDRFKYLEIGGHIGIDSFGFNRYLNQNFYHSPEWLQVRDKVIIRDQGMDLGVDGYPINGRIVIHHINPITIEDVIDRNPDIFNLDYLICCSHQTHNALHYGNEDYLSRFQVVERKPNDTVPWR
jgi:hypothetical protein